MNSNAKSPRTLSGWVRREWSETAVLLRCIPAVVVSLFSVSVICMNLLANKTLVQTDWIALDGGILVSWLSFMCMDVITKYFGPRASNRIAVLAAGINVLTCLIFYIASVIPSDADDYTALNGILGGTWFILFGSTVAFLLSAVINNFLNWSIGQMFRKHPDGKAAYAARTYISTLIGQFAWTFVQCVACALTGAVAELVMEIVFSPIGYRVVTKWQRYHVGQEYLTLTGGRG